MNLKWYYHRLKMMSIPEVFFRIREAAVRRLDARNKTGKFPQPLIPQKFTKVFNSQLKPDILLESRIEFFEKELDFSGEIDWHLDLKTGNRFPLTNAFTIDIRTPRFGSAKHVWEVNRLSFLPVICLNFQQAKERSFLLKFMALTSDWIEKNPYLLGVNWYSNIEVNVRLINWFVCWEILDGPALLKVDEEFREFAQNKWFPAIYLHCQHSFRHPSKYSSANNHLISEHAGLFIAASVWKFKESEKWLRHAKKGLEREIILQHTSSGINREEAAEYIQFITDFFLVSYIVGNSTGNPFSDQYREMLQKIGNYIFEFTDDAGNYPKYGDEDDGQLLRFSSKLENNFLSILFTMAVLFDKPYLAGKCRNVDLKSKILLDNTIPAHFPVEKKDSQKSKFYASDGHFILRSLHKKNPVYIHFDAAPLGYLSIAAHGHADALSFIMHVNNHPVFVDPGTYSYHADPEWRKYFISTLAHNTVCINGENQASFGGSTLWITKYRTNVIDSRTDENEDFIHASHDGYLKAGIAHSRKFTFLKDEKKVLIEDILDYSGNKEIQIDMPFHLHPDLTVENEDSIFTIRGEKFRVSLKPDSSLSATLVCGAEDPLLGWYSESFQKLKPTSVIVCRKLVKASTTFTTEISILDD